MSVDWKFFWKEFMKRRTFVFATILIILMGPLAFNPEAYTNGWMSYRFQAFGLDLPYIVIPSTYFVAILNYLVCMSYIGQRNELLDDESMERFQAAQARDAAIDKVIEEMKKKIAELKHD